MFGNLLQLIFYLILEKFVLQKEFENDSNVCLYFDMRIENGQFILVVKSCLKSGREEYFKEKNLN